LAQAVVWQAIYWFRDFIPTMYRYRIASALSSILHTLACAASFAFLLGHTCSSPASTPIFMVATLVVYVYDIVGILGGLPILYGWTLKVVLAHHGSAIFLWAGAHTVVSRDPMMACIAYPIASLWLTSNIIEAFWSAKSAVSNLWTRRVEIAAREVQITILLSVFPAVFGTTFVCGTRYCWVAGGIYWNSQSSMYPGTLSIYNRPHHLGQIISALPPVMLFFSCGLLFIWSQTPVFLCRSFLALEKARGVDVSTSWFAWAPALPAACLFVVCRCSQGADAMGVDNFAGLIISVSLVPWLVSRSCNMLGKAGGSREASLDLAEHRKPDNAAYYAPTLLQTAPTGSSRGVERTPISDKGPAGLESR